MCIRDSSSIVPGSELGTVSHYDVQSVLDVYTNVDGTDLGTVTRSIEQIMGCLLYTSRCV